MCEDEPGIKKKTMATAVKRSCQESVYKMIETKVKLKPGQDIKYLGTNKGFRFPALMFQLLDLTPWSRKSLEDIFLPSPYARHEGVCYVAGVRADALT